MVEPLAGWGRRPSLPNPDVANALGAGWTFLSVIRGGHSRFPYVGESTKRGLWRQKPICVSLRNRRARMPSYVSFVQL